MSNIIDLKLEETTWDLLIENQDIQTVTGIDGIKQHLRQRYQMFKGEYFYDKTRGIPYHDDLFVKSPNPIIVDTVFKKVTLDTPGIVELLKFDLDFDGTTRELNINLKAKTDVGEMDYIEIVPL